MKTNVFKCDFGGHWLQCQWWTLYEHMMSRQPKPKGQWMSKVSMLVYLCRCCGRLCHASWHRAEFARWLKNTGRPGWRRILPGLGKEHPEGSSGCNCKSPGAPLINDCTWVVLIPNIKKILKMIIHDRNPYQATGFWTLLKCLLRYFMVVFRWICSWWLNPIESLKSVESSITEVHGATPGQPGKLQQFPLRNQSQRFHNLYFQTSQGVLESEVATSPFGWCLFRKVVAIITNYSFYFFFMGMEIELSLSMWSCVWNAYQPPWLAGCNEIQQWGSYGFVWK